MTPTHCGKWLAAKKDRDWKWYKRKMYSMCRIYTQNVYTLYYEEAHTYTHRENTHKRHKRLQNYSIWFLGEVHKRIIGLAPKNRPPTSPKFGGEFPIYCLVVMLARWNAQWGEIVSTLLKIKNGTPYSLIDSTYKWQPARRQDWKRGLEHGIQSHRGKKLLCFSSLLPLDSSGM